MNSCRRPRRQRPTRQGAPRAHRAGRGRRGARPRARPRQGCWGRRTAVPRSGRRGSGASARARGRPAAGLGGRWGRPHLRDTQHAGDQRGRPACDEA
eukprot:795239-Pyramimonas_sp.AAC.1